MIVSVSRRTDIPAHYPDWFFKRLQEGFALARNPFNLRQVSRVNLSIDAVDCFVFWTKNPAPMLERLNGLKRYPYYFQYTLNQYSKDIEPGLPSENMRVEAFQRLVDRIGPERVVWRYDPVFLNDIYTVEYHAEAFEKLAAKLHGYTQKCIVSFLDNYAKIKKRITALGITAPNDGQKVKILRSFSAAAKKNGMRLESCAEKTDFSPYGVYPGKCIDHELISSITGKEIAYKKDPNQRKECGCVASVDIGAYDTCPTGCIYCYASNTKASVRNNKACDLYSPLLCGTLLPGDVVKDRK